MIVIIEILTIIIIAIVAIVWFFNPKGNYEPLIILLGLVFVITEIKRRKKINVNPEKIQVEGNNDDLVAEKSPEERGKQQTLPHRVNSANFFAERFGLAFPGVREIKWFSPEEGVMRLSKLFEPPYFYQGADGSQTPIWWFRDGNMGIDNFRLIDRTTILLDYKELKIKRLAAVPSTSYYQQFIYIETEPMRPTGLYLRPHDTSQETIDYFGYDWEEYGLYKGKHLVTRSQYDDNAAVIAGKLVELGADVEIRSRYTTPYNLVIAPVSSPINNTEFDQELVQKLGEILHKHTKINELSSMVKRLPPHPHMHKM